MSYLVFLEPNKISAIPFTTSEVIAEYAKIKHHAIQVIISKYENDLKEFGQVSFEIRAVVYARGTNQEKIYHLNEEQATLLITYLKNTEPVREFKKNLVKQFYIMRSELQKRQLQKEYLKPIHRGLTDAIKDSPHSNKWLYKQYTDLSYKTALGKSASQIRKERGAKHSDVAIDYMTSNEIEQVHKTEHQISVLVDMGMDYSKVKSIVLNHRVSGKLA